MATYAEKAAAAADKDFQARCEQALYDVCIKVLADTAGYPAAGQAAVDPADDDAFATKVLRGWGELSPTTLVTQFYRNAAIATNLQNATDGDLQYTVNATIWAALREIG